MAGLELPKTEYQIHRQIEIKNLSAFFITLKKGENRYATERISQTAQGSLWHPDGQQQMDVPTDTDTQFIKDMIAEKLQEEYGLTPKEFSEGIDGMEIGGMT